MGDSGFQYSEAFLQWIWQNGLFDQNGLKTECGKPVQILELGELNLTDGPDFKSSRVAVGEMIWHGNIELHLKSKDWYAHGHHKDENYNTVILHVVAKGDADQVVTQNGGKPFTLKLEQYLSNNLRVFLRSFENKGVLPCSGNLNYISEEVFYKQIEKAHSEYLEKKTDDFLAFYDPEMLPSMAWKSALILSVWDGLGITHNRRAMILTAKRLLRKWDGGDVDKGMELALKIGGFVECSDSDINWNLKGVRPANYPLKRIQEAVKISSEILKTPFERFLKKENIDLWKQFCEHCKVNSSSRHEIIFGTVYLPALYTLGMLYSYEGLKEQVRTAWTDLKTPIPQTLLKKFKALQLSKDEYRRKLGSIHQLKSYCRPRKCSECFVLKNAIQS